MDNRNDPLDCVKCYDWYMKLPMHIVAAASSVGISRNMSTSQVLKSYVRSYHNRDHRDV